MRALLSSLLFASILGCVAACSPALATTTPPPPPTLAPIPQPPTTIAPPSVTPAPPTSTAVPTAQAATEVPAPTQTKAVPPAAEPTDAPRAHVSLTRYDIDHAKYPKALCNDGSTPVYYLRRGYGSGANKWIVFLEGGGACWDDETCTTRDRNLVSSIGYRAHTLDRDGVLSDDPKQNPDFYSWNQVFLPYCSSDFYSGSNTENNNSMKFYFRGHDIVEAIVGALSDSSVVGPSTLKQATNIIFAGSSAGGIGVRVNLDRLAKELSWADVRGVEDALMFIPVNPTFIQNEQVPRGNAMMTLYQPVLDETCQASSPDRPWLCLGDSYAIVNKQISTPLFVRNDLYDPINLQFQDLDLKDPQTRPYASAAAMKYSQILKELPGAFGTATADHVTMGSTKFNQDKVDGLTFAQVLGNWYFYRSGPKVVVAPLRR